MSEKLNKLCWICKRNCADSQEHMFKVSDLKLHSGGITPEKKFYKQIDFGQKDKIKSIRSNKFTFYSEICRNCNNERTQPYDMAWSILSKYMYDNFDELSIYQRFSPSAAFKSDHTKMMRFVHLYFCKILGCYLKDANQNTSPKAKYKFYKIAKSLIEIKDNPLIFLNFGYNPYVPKDEIHFLMNEITLEWNKKSHKAIKASTFLSIGRLVIGIAYWDTGKSIKDWWNPMIHQDYITFKNLSEYIPTESYDYFE